MRFLCELEFSFPLGQMPKSIIAGLNGRYMFQKNKFFLEYLYVCWQFHIGGFFSSLEGYKVCNKKAQNLQVTTPLKPCGPKQSTFFFYLSYLPIFVTCVMSRVLARMNVAIRCYWMGRFPLLSPEIFPPPNEKHTGYLFITYLLIPDENRVLINCEIVIIPCHLSGA